MVTCCLLHPREFHDSTQHLLAAVNPAAAASSHPATLSTVHTVMHPYKHWLRPLYAGLMALQRGDTAAAREAADGMSYINLPAVGGRRAELETLVLVREVGEAEGDAKQGPLLEQLRTRAGVSLDTSEVSGFQETYRIKYNITSHMRACMLVP